MIYAVRGCADLPPRLLLQIALRLTCRLARVRHGTRWRARVVRRVAGRKTRSADSNGERPNAVCNSERSGASQMSDGMCVRHGFSRDRAFAFPRRAPLDSVRFRIFARNAKHAQMENRRGVSDFFFKLGRATKGI